MWDFKGGKKCLKINKKEIIHLTQKTEVLFFNW